ncbi:MAG TPA: hypothetical protein VGF82_05405, partial [Terracidiphilus sp.]
RCITVPLLWGEKNREMPTTLQNLQTFAVPLRDNEDLCGRKKVDFEARARGLRFALEVKGLDRVRAKC